MASVAAALSLAGNAFVLSWTHSVERVEWQEHWQVREGLLQMDQARVKGSGAGMEPPPDSRLRDGWWVYRPHLPPQPSVLLAVSGQTVDGWRLCVDGGKCHDIETLLAPGQKIDLVRLSAGPRCEVLPR